MLPICLSLMNCSSFPEAWKDYKQIFIEEGRVIDTGNKRISHSEGQGYGMLLSVYFNDEHAFEEMWAWTKQNLQVRKDHLFSWLWAKGPNGSFEVMDTNNATDGDLLIAYSLFQASKQWNNESYSTIAKDISKSLRNTVLKKIQNNKYLLLPAEYGFQNNGLIAFNPSYQIMAAYDALSELESPNTWHKIQEDSLSLIKKSSNNAYGLPPDWAAVQTHTNGTSPVNPVSPWPDKSFYFGDEAIRVLLYQLWQQELTVTPHYLFDQYQLSGRISRYIPQKNNKHNQEAMAGYYAIVGMNAKRAGKTEIADQLLKKAKKILLKENNNYYSHTLYLLAISSNHWLAQ